MGFITGPDKPGIEEIVSLANEWGYTEDLSGPVSISMADEDESVPQYPQAKVSKFKATDSEEATREGVTIKTRVEYPPVYIVSERTEGKAVGGTKNLAIFLTLDEADAYADKTRAGAAKGITIKVRDSNMPRILTCTLFKPL
jgi:hypothetical protein